MALLRGFFAVLDHILGFYILLLFAAMILRLVRADPYNPFVRGLYALTDPPGRWLTRRFPGLMVHTGNGAYMDFGPTLVMVGVVCLRIFLPYLEEFILGLF